MMNSYDGFISFSKNFDKVDAIYTHLKSNGLLIWKAPDDMPRDTRDWEQSIRDIIVQSRAVLYMASPEALASSVVKGELSFAQSKDITIYALWITGDEWTDCIPFALTYLHRIDLRGSSYTSGLEEITSILKQKRAVRDCSALLEHFEKLSELLEKQINHYDNSIQEEILMHIIKIRDTYENCGDKDFRADVQALVLFIENNNIKEAQNSLNKAKLYLKSHNVVNLSKNSKKVIAYTPLVLVRKGDILEGGFDLTVLPCSAKGTVSSTVTRHIENYDIPRPAPMEHGDLGKLVKIDNPNCPTKSIVYAASVFNDYSSIKIVRELGKRVGVLANSHPEIHRIEAPLLGAGDGGLETLDAAQALKKGFEAAKSKAQLTIFVNDKSRLQIIAKAFSE